MRLVMLVTIPLLFSLISPLARAEEGRPEPITIDTYKPMDALIGHPYTKIDVSFKARLLEDHNLYFGYTQLMMWKVLQENAYFEDINYSPELFYRLFIGSETHWIDIGGFQHESNGVGFTNEKSWNRSYLRYHSQNLLGGNTVLFWSVTGWVPYDYDKHNPDIIRYRGLYELNATLSGWMGKSLAIGDVGFRLFPGGPSGLDPARGGQEVTLRVKTGSRKFLPPVELQLFHGYGENLLDYKVSHFEFRAGIGF